MKHYPRIFEGTLLQRLKKKPQFIQTILGPRQIGKSSGVLHVLEENFAKKDYEYLSSEDEIFDPDWFLAQVQKAAQNGKKIIVFDEVQKIEKWPELVKRSWDLQKRQKNLMHWILLGSSSLKLTQGLSDSLAGRFEIITAPHWSFQESHAAFGLNLQDYLSYGGYPASYLLLDEPSRFRNYMLESIFEAVVSLDILRHTTVKKPALFRQTFMLACQYPAQEVSYNKLLGQLQEAGNVDQIKHYLDLFSQAFLIRQIFKYSARPLSRLSSPKIIPCAPVFSSLFLRRAMTTEEMGRAFEAVVGNSLCQHFESVHYWREGHEEVDYVVEDNGQLYAIEVKSQMKKLSKAEAFRKKFKKSRFCRIDFENFEYFDQNPKQFLKRFAI
jgi:predicted AAA+ superfamily ATPase